jgi:hypothetical protein
LAHTSPQRHPPGLIDLPRIDLERHVASAPRFAELVLAAAAADVGRGGETAASRDTFVCPPSTEIVVAPEYRVFGVSYLRRPQSFGNGNRIRTGIALYSGFG